MAFGKGYPRLMAEVRAAFPSLGIAVPGQHEPTSWDAVTELAPGSVGRTPVARRPRPRPFSPAPGSLTTRTDVASTDPPTPGTPNSSQ
jgi:hypothetical protein